MQSRQHQAQIQGYQINNRVKKPMSFFTQVHQEVLQSIQGAQECKLLIVWGSGFR